MAQFDVHRSPARGHPAVPFVVVLQSAWFEAAPDRPVAPLLLAEAVADLRPPPHVPRFQLAGCPLLLDPQQCRPVPKRLLGPAVASLAADGDASRIIAAFDEVLSRVHG